MAIEPHLQPLQGEALHNQSSNCQSGARLDIAADGFWGSRHEIAFFDVRVFNPYAPSNRNSHLTTCYRSHENAKKRSYDQRIREVEHGSFTPLVLSCTGGMGRASVNTYKRLAALISTKRDDIYTTPWAGSDVVSHSLCYVRPQQILSPGSATSQHWTNNTSPFSLFLLFTSPLYIFIFHLLSKKKKKKKSLVPRL